MKFHCFFEQSGTFKNEFKKLGYEAEDYDIQNEFNETDNIIDLFSEIKKGYNKEKSVFDNIKQEDVILAFFPCIRFEAIIPLKFRGEAIDQKNWDLSKKLKYSMKLQQELTELYNLLSKLVLICLDRKLKIIIENPYTQPHYLTNNFVVPPAVIDMDRSMRGDFRRKPTQYFYFNCKPTCGESYQQTPPELIKTHDDLRGGIHAGICSEERSMISSDYARNWICDFVLGKTQNISQLCFDF